ncbi:hypothetical protein [Idiomarina abyssalis]|uniref:Uncharacterized protein n=1 Tax=Idiomarina abyssalis TaxID=86102 RepID=A0A8I1GB43_9GAMM|nr:hypothetical protein [Idiomarina abyssalis]MBJ7265536.1 hypothetical protein [Idiomarina abyssalis]MBJ7316790.1 hypothetical protein [Idiomarina abyssalis]
MSDYTFSLFPHEVAAIASDSPLDSLSFQRLIANAGTISNADYRFEAPSSASGETRNMNDINGPLSLVEGDIPLTSFSVSADSVARSPLLDFDPEGADALGKASQLDIAMGSFNRLKRYLTPLALDNLLHRTGSCLELSSGLYFSSATSKKTKSISAALTEGYHSLDITELSESSFQAYLKLATGAGVEEVLAHIYEHSELPDKVTLDLGDSDAPIELNVDYWIGVIAPQFERLLEQLLDDC